MFGLLRKMVNSLTTDVISLVLKKVKWDKLLYVPGDENITITGTITNLEDNTTHFANQEICDKLISIDEWREIQLSKLI